MADGRKPRFLTKMVVIGRLCYGGLLLGPLCQAKIRIWPQETRKPPLPTCDPVHAGTSRRRSEPFVNHPLWPTRHDVAPSSGATSYWYIRPCMTDVCIRGFCFGAVLGRCWPVLCRHVTGFGRCWGDFGRLADVGRSLICFCRFWLGVADIWPRYGYSYCTRVHTRPAGHAFVFLCTGHVVGQRPGRTWSGRLASAHPHWMTLRPYPRRRIRRKDRPF